MTAPLLPVSERILVAIKATLQGINGPTACTGPHYHTSLGTAIERQIPELPLKATPMAWIKPEGFEPVEDLTSADGTVIEKFFRVAIFFVTDDYVTGPTAVEKIVADIETAMLQELKRTQVGDAIDTTLTGGEYDVVEGIEPLVSGVVRFKIHYRQQSKDSAASVG